VITFDVATTRNIDESYFEHMFQSNIMRLLPSFTKVLLKESDEDHIPYIALQKMYSEWFECRNGGMKYGSTYYVSQKTVFFNKHVSTSVLVGIEPFI